MRSPDSVDRTRNRCGWIDRAHAGSAPPRGAARATAPAAVTTKTPWSLERAPPADGVRRREGSKAVRVAVSAGMRPNAQTLSMLSAMVKARTRGSTAGRSASSSGPASETSRSDAQKDSNNPPAAPAAASSMLSVSNCRTSRDLDAPTAARMATSSERPRATRQQQIRDVGAGNEQNEPVRVSSSTARGNRSLRPSGGTGEPRP